MSSGTTNRRDQAPRQSLLAQMKQAQRRTRRRRTLIRAGTAALVVAILAVAITAMMLTSRPAESTSTRSAPDFTLTDTSGHQISLAGLRGRPVLLYFNEGAGCGSCFQQMAAIEKQQRSFDAAGITVLPIAMNSREQLKAEMTAYGTTTPFLIDDGTVSGAYGTLGKGMHAGLPGHSFVLIDAQGFQRWSAEYPSMWVDPTALLEKVRSRLP